MSETAKMAKALSDRALGEWFASLSPGVAGYEAVATELRKRGMLS